MISRSAWHVVYQLCPRILPLVPCTQHPMYSHLSCHVHSGIYKKPDTGPSELCKAKLFMLSSPAPTTRLYFSKLLIEPWNLRGSPEYFTIIAHPALSVPSKFVIVPKRASCPCCISNPLGGGLLTSLWIGVCKADWVLYRVSLGYKAVCILYMQVYILYLKDSVYPVYTWGVLAQC